MEKKDRLFSFYSESDFLPRLEELQNDNIEIFLGGILDDKIKRYEVRVSVPGTFSPNTTDGGKIALTYGIPIAVVEDLPEWRKQVENTTPGFMAVGLSATLISVTGHLVTVELPEEYFRSEIRDEVNEEYIKSVLFEKLSEEEVIAALLLDRAVKKFIDRWDDWPTSFPEGFFDPVMGEVHIDALLNDEFADLSEQGLKLLREDLYNAFYLTVFPSVNSIGLPVSVKTWADWDLYGGVFNAPIDEEPLGEYVSDSIESFQVYLKGETSPDEVESIAAKSYPNDELKRERLKLRLLRSAKRKLEGKRP